MMKKFTFNRLLFMAFILACPLELANLVRGGVMTVMEFSIWSILSLVMFGANVWDVQNQARKRALQIVNDAGELCERSQYRAALNSLEIAAQLDPRCFEVVMARGEIYRSEQAYDRARQEFRQAITMNEKSFKAHFSLGLVYLQEKKVYEAISEFRHTISLKPEFCESYFILAQAYELAAEKENAVKMYKKFLSIVTPEDLLNKKYQDYSDRANARIRQL